MLVDALVACAAGSDLVLACARLRVVVLAHMPFPDCPVLAAAAAVVTTSRSTRDRLLAEYRLAPQRVHVAEPGVDPAEPVVGSADGSALLCVGALAPHKGQDVLLDALAELTDLSWRCTCVGPLDRDPAYVRSVRDRAVASRVEFPGPRTGSDLDRTYATSDLLVVPSRNEAYGMVVTEALARGLPVIASDVGGVAESLGRSAGGRLPGVLVPPGDIAALADALRRWLDDSGWRGGTAGRRFGSASHAWRVGGHRAAGCGVLCARDVPAGSRFVGKAHRGGALGGRGCVAPPGRRSRRAARRRHAARIFIFFC